MMVLTSAATTWKRINFDLQISPLFAHGHNFIGRLIVWRDITVRKQLEEELEQRVSERTAALASANAQLMVLDRVKDEFIARVSHELRTPLTNVKLYAHLLEKADAEKQPAYLQTLKQETNQLQQLIEDMLTFSQVSQERTQVIVVSVDVNHILAQLAEEWQPIANERGTVLCSNMDPVLPMALSEESLLRRVLTHLLDNALNYARHSTVTLNTYVGERQDRRWICIGVHDTGPGLDENDKEQIFQRFYRGQAASTYEVAGMGIGLAASREIMHTLQGDLTVESQRGQGTCFTAWLPIA